MSEVLPGVAAAGCCCGWQKRYCHRLASVATATLYICQDMPIADFTRCTQPLFCPLSRSIQPRAVLPQAASYCRSQKRMVECHFGVGGSEWFLLLRPQLVTRAVAGYE